MLTGQHHLVSTDTAFVNVLTRGDLSSLHWIESPLRYFSSADHPQHQLCRVHYTALNFRDVMLATGKLPPDAIPGTSADVCLMESRWNAVQDAAIFMLGKELIFVSWFWAGQWAFTRHCGYISHGTTLRCLFEQHAPILMQSYLTGMHPCHCAIIPP